MYEHTPSNTIQKPDREAVVSSRVFNVKVDSTFEASRQVVEGWDQRPGVGCGGEKSST